MPITTDALREVVSGKVHTPGDVIKYGDVVSEVSGRPVFAVPTFLPLYRDLRMGDKGEDVKALQRMLRDIGLYKGEIDGVLGSGDIQAISYLYTRAGYKAPNPVVFLMAHSAPIPKDGVKVAHVAALGQEITQEHPLATVESTAAVITMRVDILQAQAFTVGTTVLVKVGSNAPVSSEVLSVGEFKEASQSAPPGYDVTVVIPGGVDPEIAEQSPVIVSESVEVEKGPAVPLIAIRRDSGGATYVMLPTPETGATPAPQRVDVTVVGQSAGYAVIEENPLLPVGAVVQVSGG